MGGTVFPDLSGATTGKGGGAFAATADGTGGGPPATGGGPGGRPAGTGGGGGATGDGAPVAAGVTTGGAKGAGVFGFSLNFPASPAGAPGATAGSESSREPGKAQATVRREEE